ncbi:MAG: hypothetical protein DRO04_03105 [Candidatus Iainarchaeum archaeon]|uniref:ATP-grasp domain-containing protein n=1 Tax=Candidatus Iainarchaeum sp. TaxID=3101447 RepID=A0A497JFJ4_9ARCH|nr:MAG: hypothetical protein DRO04_03105 [Candidatus Diapherotrites archaeon]
MKFLLVEGVHSTEDVRLLVLEEAKKYFDTVLSVPLSKLKIECLRGENKVYYKNTLLNDFDAFYIRVFAEDFAFAQPVLYCLSKSRGVMPHCLEAFSITNNKYHTTKLVSELNIKVPATALTTTPEATMQIVEKIGYPAVVKLLSGFGGKGVMLVNSEKELKPILDTLNIFEEFICLQEYIPAGKKDIRYLVVDDDVIAILREGKDWRANVSIGGKAAEIPVEKELKDTAIKAAKFLGLKICAVDFVQNVQQENYLIEVNFTPGFMKNYLHNRIPRAIVKYLYKCAKRKK